MIDTLVRLLEHARSPALADLEERFVLVTLHRPSNVDNPEMLGRIMETLERISAGMQVIFPIHPRTRQRLAGICWAQSDSKGRLMLCGPLGYLEFLWLQQHATAVLTDSGGIQEETTFLRVPCLTLRDNTERPITCEIGTNQLVGRDMERVEREVGRISRGEVRPSKVPPLWDGHTGERIARVLVGKLG
jgi:UDP-N-acetylglucosamine 2-epimerase (non-hydrolysing)